MFFKMLYDFDLQPYFGTSQHTVKAFLVSIQWNMFVDDAFLKFIPPRSRSIVSINPV